MFVIPHHRPVGLALTAAPPDSRASSAPFAGPEAGVCGAVTCRCRGQAGEERKLWGSLSSRPAGLFSPRWGLAGGNSDPALPPQAPVGC